MGADLLLKKLNNTENEGLRKLLFEFYESSKNEHDLFLKKWKRHFLIASIMAINISWYDLARACLEKSMTALDQISEDPQLLNSLHDIDDVTLQRAIEEINHR